MGLLIKTSEDQSFWIDVEGSKFLVCPITGSRDTAIARKYTKFKNGFPQADQNKIRIDKFSETVKDWQGIKDVNGNEVPFSEQMRHKFAELNPDFAWMVIRKAEQHEVDAREEEYANLGEQ